MSLAVLVIPCILVSVDLSVLYLAAPSIAVDLGASAVQLLWIMDIYGFLLAGLLVLAGALADRFGARRMLIIGAFLFGVCSLACALSSTPLALIVSRALLGAAGATIMPTTLSLIRNIFTQANDRQLAVSVWTAGFAGGGAIGPIIGGMLLSSFSWGAVFLMNIPVMLVLIVMARLLLPEFRASGTHRFDAAGAVLLVAATLLLVYSLKETAAGELHPSLVLTWTGGAALAALFVHRQLRTAHPLADLRLFADVRFAVSFAANSLTLLVCLAVGLFISQYLQLVLGFTPLVTALWMLPGAGGLVVGSALAPALARRARTTTLLAAGHVIVAIGFACLFAAGARSGAWGASLAYGLTAAGLGLASSVAVTIIVGIADPAKAGAAAGLSEMGGELGGALGIAVLGSVLTVAYRASLGPALPPRLPTQDRAEALRSLGAAVSMNGDPLFAATAQAARDAFVTGMHLVAALSIALMLALAVVCVASRSRHTVTNW